jgi:hypothetical protein
MFLCLDQMYAEICAYLTGNKYFELPTYRVSDFIIDKFSKEFIFYFHRNLWSILPLYFVWLFSLACVSLVLVLLHIRIGSMNSVFVCLLFSMV